jgi:hypothetical protein
VEPCSGDARLLGIAFKGRHLWKLGVNRRPAARRPTATATEDNADCA